MPRGELGIFVATMTGLADICAEEIEVTLSRMDIACSVHSMEAGDARAMLPYDVVLVISSTYGHGDIPDNGQAFYESLVSGIDLSGKRYAIFALGDRTYADTFCAAAEKWDEALFSAGATRLVDVARHDASAGTLAEDIAGEWVTGWVEQICGNRQ